MNEPPQGAGTRLVFEGAVETGDAYRVGEGEKHGAVHIGGRDVVKEIDDTFHANEPLFIAILCGFLLGNCTFEGALRIAEGWGYSEYTPMASDELCVGPHNILEQLTALEGRNATLLVSDAPMNILEGARFAAPSPSPSQPASGETT
jgi:hypothetical protein